MSLTRYERLNTDSGRQDDGAAGAPAARHGYSQRYSIDEDDDDENEEIELGTEHRLRYEDVAEDDYEDNCPPANGHANSGANGAYDAAIATHLAGARFMQMAIGTLATILLYLTLSICLTFYQKALIKKMQFPFTIVCYHLVIKLMLAALVRAVYKWRMGKTRIQLDWRTSLRKMAPTGIASGIDIGFSNWGLELVPISLYTMTKSSTIVFILFFAILLGLEKKSPSLVGIVGLIAIGLFMFTYKSTQFDALGFSFILVASFSSGVRWSFAQFVMQKSKLGMHNPIDMIFHMQPWMVASLLPFLAAIEGQKLYDVLRELPTTPNDVVYMVIFKISFGAVLAFLMEVVEFMVLSQTSSLTLSIAGIFKDICQLALAVELNGDQLSLINVFGLVVCLAGICCHLVHKYAMMSKMGDQLHSYENGSPTSVSGDATTTTILNAASGMGAAGGHTTIAVQKPKHTHSAQTVPLLEDSDSDDSTNVGGAGGQQSASDVIFDVLKRRDMQR